MKYPVAKTDLTGNERKYLKQCIDDNWVSSTGKFVEKFEEAFAKYIGTKYAVACNSGTSAIHLALSALGIKEGDEVIVPNFTMVASAWPVSYLGATPVFVDCGVDLNINVDKVEQAITKNTKAIIAVHIYGRVCDMSRLEEICFEYNIALIEDAAEAYGASTAGIVVNANGTSYAESAKKVGTFGDMGCFSLMGNKIITAGEGGVITTDSEKLKNQLVHLHSMAFNKGHTFEHKKMAYNYRMPNASAAIALAQLERINKFLEKRQQIAEWYDEYLDEYTLERPKGSVLWVYDILVDADIKNRVMKRLADQWIETRHFFKPMDKQPMYRNEEASEAQLFADSGFYLPVYTQMTKKDVEFISKTFLKIYGEEKEKSNSN